MSTLQSIKASCSAPMTQNKKFQLAFRYRHNRNGVCVGRRAGSSHSVHTRTLGGCLQLDPRRPSQGRAGLLIFLSRSPPLSPRQGFGPSTSASNPAPESFEFLFATRAFITFLPCASVCNPCPLPSDPSPSPCLHPSFFLIDIASIVFLVRKPRSNLLSSLGSQVTGDAGSLRSRSV